MRSTSNSRLRNNHSFRQQPKNPRLTAGYFCCAATESPNPVMNGLKYWDPSKSMFDEAVSIIQNDPTKLPEGETEVTQENYFRIASLERLGTEQSTQFQDVNSGQTGWNWAWTSKLNESGDPVGTDSNCSGKTNSSASYKTAVGVCFEYNSRADIPRTEIGRAHV